MTNNHISTAAGNGSPAVVHSPSKRNIEQTYFHFYEKRSVPYSEARALLQRVRQKPVQILYISMNRSREQ